MVKQVKPTAETLGKYDESDSEGTVKRQRCGLHKGQSGQAHNRPNIRMQFYC